METPLGPAVPRSGSRLGRWFGRVALWTQGWRVAGDFPDIPQCVLIVAPHTSNWDFVHGLAAKWALGLRVRFLAKHTLFRFPLGLLMRSIGGIPVDRRSSQGLAEAIAEEFRSERPLWLVIAPEGTRRRVSRWKTGFHRIAVTAGVPILPIALDYPARAVHALPLFMPSGRYDADLRALAAHFAAGMAYRPERYAVPTADAGSDTLGAP